MAVEQQRVLTETRTRTLSDKQLDIAAKLYARNKSIEYRYLYGASRQRLMEEFNLSYGSIWLITKGREHHKKVRERDKETRKMRNRKGTPDWQRRKTKMWVDRFELWFTRKYPFLRSNGTSKVYMICRKAYLAARGIEEVER